MRERSIQLLARVAASLPLLSVAAVLSMVPAPALRAEEPPARAEREAWIYARVDIDQIGGDRLAELEAVEGLEWWVEADDRLLILAPEERLAGLDPQLVVERLEVVPRPARLYVVERAHRRYLEAMDVDVLVEGGRHAVVQARDLRIPRLPEEVTGEERNKTICHGDGLASLAAFRPDTVFSRQVHNDASVPAVSLDASLGRLADEIDTERWFADVLALTRFNRYAYSRDISRARDWVVGRFAEIPGLEVETEGFSMPFGEGDNVVATVHGRTRPDEVYVIGAHYDSSSEFPQFFAPGAEDNASGCAGIVELARVLVPHAPEATIQFVCYSGSAQGYLGSRHHASRLAGGGQRRDIRAALILDMISFTEDADLDCLLEAPPESRPLIDLWAAAAARFTRLRIVYSLLKSESDLSSYLDRGIPGLLIAGNDWSRYPDYHQQTDVASNLSADLAEQVLRLNVAALGHLAGAVAPPAPQPLFGDGFESGDLRGWEAH